MIVYLATYPRSGNSQLQRLIAHNLCFLTSAVTGQGGSTPGFADWDLRADPEPSRWPAGLLWNERTLTYLRQAPAEIEVSFDRDLRWRYFAPGPMLSEKARRALAAEPTPFFIKTHDLPFETFFEGERVIQVQRNPGAVLWSYFRFLLDFQLKRKPNHIFSSPPVTLDRVIDGDVRFGSWTAYHAAWGAAIDGLGERGLSLRYADMTHEKDRTLDQISAFIGHPVERRDAPDFAGYKARSAGRGLRGTEEGYERFYTRGQLERLWERHGEAAANAGFSPPDLDAAQEGDQIDRLNEIIEMAWTYGASHQETRAALKAKVEQLLAEKAKAEK